MKLTKEELERRDRLVRLINAQLERVVMDGETELKRTGTSFNVDTGETELEVKFEGKEYELAPVSIHWLTPVPRRWLEES